MGFCNAVVRGAEPCCCDCDLEPAMRGSVPRVASEFADAVRGDSVSEMTELHRL